MLSLPSTRSLLKSFRALDSLTSLELRYNQTVFNVWKKHPDFEKYNLTCNDTKLWNLSFDQLIGFFERLDNLSSQQRCFTLEFSCYSM